MKLSTSLALLLALFHLSLFSQEVPCEEPYPQITNLTVAFGDGAMVLNWTPILGSQACRIQMRPVGTEDSQFQLVEGSDQGSFNISGEHLLFQTEYEAKVSCGCSEDPLIFGAYSNKVNFFTGSIGQIVPCEEPYPLVGGLSAAPTENLDGIKLMWTPISSSKGCHIEFRGFNGHLVAAELPGHELSEYVIPASQLLMNYDYSWRIRCGCSFNPRVVGPWSSSGYFYSGNVGELEGFFPKPKFRADPQAPLVGVEVEFRDFSQFEPTSWLWDFGDGSTSTEADPFHSYADAGLYSVSLTAANEFGESTITHEAFIEAFDPVCPTSLTDIHGNQYSVVQMGNACWTGENLLATQFNNGDEIPIVIPMTDWQNSTTPSYCNFENNEAFADTTGRLYNGYVVLDERNVCPVGWHVSAESDWLALEEVMGMSPEQLNSILPERGKALNIGGQLKAAEYWSPFNRGGKDSYGLRLLPLGYRYFVFIEYIGLQTTARFYAPNDLEEGPEIYYRGFSYLSKGIARVEAQLIEGMSIRCVQD